jgi:serine/threonine protein kinase
LESLLGRGATGLTWAAHHEALDVSVVVKLLDPAKSWGSSKIAERFLAEGKALARLQHPHVVRVMTAGQEEKSTYLILERLVGGDLRARLRQETPELAEAVEWSACLAEGLAAIHGAGLVHRDVKPENVIFDGEGQPKLVDLGIAFEEGERDQATVQGTPAYMSPEAALGRPLDGRSDLYSLGVVLYELVANRWPYNAPEPRLLLRKHVEADLDTEPLSAAGASRALIGFLKRALAKDPEDRPPDGATFAQELRRAMATKTVRRRTKGRRRSSSGNRARMTSAGRHRVPRQQSSSGSGLWVILLVVGAVIAVAATLIASN